MLLRHLDLACRLTGLAGLEAVLMGLKQVLYAHRILLRRDLASCLMEDLGLRVANIRLVRRRRQFHLGRSQNAGLAGRVAFGLCICFSVEDGSRSRGLIELTGFGMIDLAGWIAAKAGGLGAGNSGKNQTKRKDRCSTKTFHAFLLAGQKYKRACPRSTHRACLHDIFTTSRIDTGMSATKGSDGI